MQPPLIDIGFEKNGKPYFYASERFEKRVITTFENLKSFEEFDWKFGLGRNKQVDLDTEEESEYPQKEYKKGESDNIKLTESDEDNEIILGIIDQIKNSPFREEFLRDYHHAFVYFFNGDEIRVDTHSDGKCSTMVNNEKLHVSQSLSVELFRLIQKKQNEYYKNDGEDYEKQKKDKKTQLRNKYRTSIDTQEMDTRTWDNYNTRRFTK